MFNPRRLVIQRFIAELEKNFARIHGKGYPQEQERLTWAAYMALEKIARGDCLYHNLEHVIMAVAVGQDMLLGKRIRGESITVEEWLNFTIALLTFNLGFVRGICPGDGDGRFRTGLGEETVELPRGATGAALAPWMTDRSKLMVRVHFANQPGLDVERICANIELTRFPPPNDDAHCDVNGFPGLTRAAHFIGTIADPNYMRKLNALFLELQENGLAEHLGFSSAVEFRAGYTELFRNTLAPFLGQAIAYLKETREGTRWLANMRAHLHAELHNEVALGITRKKD